MSKEKGKDDATAKKANENAIEFDESGEEIVDDTGIKKDAVTSDDDLGDGISDGAKSKSPELKTETDTELKNKAEDEIWQEIATGMGWKPKDDFKGPEDKFVDAKEFVKNERDLNVKTKETRDRLLNEVINLRDDVKGIRKHDEELMVKREKEYKEKFDKLREELNEKKVVAIEAADVGEVDKIDKELKDVDKKEEESKIKPPEKKGIDPIYTEWEKKNEWYGVDEDLTAITDTITSQNPDLELPELLNLVDTRVAKVRGRFKESKKETEVNDDDVNARKEVAVVGSTEITRSAHGEVKHTFSDLDENAQTACKRFVEMGIYKNRQEYVDEYFELNT